MPRSCQPTPFLCRSCCCCFTLRKGALIYGYLHLIGSVVVILACLFGIFPEMRVQMSSPAKVTTNYSSALEKIELASDGKCDQSNDSLAAILNTTDADGAITTISLKLISVNAFFTGVIGVPSGFILIYGVRKKNPLFLVLWLPMALLLIAEALILSITVLVLGPATIAHYLVPGAFAVIVYSFHGYFVVQSCALELMDKYAAKRRPISNLV